MATEVKVIEPKRKVWASVERTVRLAEYENVKVGVGVQEAYDAELSVPDEAARLLALRDMLAEQLVAEIARALNTKGYQPTFENASDAAAKTTKTASTTSSTTSATKTASVATTQRKIVDGVELDPRNEVGRLLKERALSKPQYASYKRMEERNGGSLAKIPEPLLAAWLTDEKLW